MKRSGIVCAILSLLIIFTLVMPLASCSGKEDIVTEIKSVELDKKGEEITLKATLEESYAKNHSKDTLYLLALPNADVDGSLEGARVVDEVRAKKKMTFKFDLYDGVDSRASYGFVIAEKNGSKYSAITEISYLENPEVLADGAKGGNGTSGIKGLATGDVFGAQMLGAEHIVLGARIDLIMLEGFEKNSVSYNCDGITYYFDKDYVEALDSAIFDADSIGMRVYLKTVLGVPETPEDEDEEAREPISFLYCKGADSDASGFAPDLSNPEAMRYIKAFYEFLADRYPVADYIIGDSVNNYAENCNAGDMSAEAFEKLYYVWARTAYNTLSSVNSSATVYIPIDNAWRVNIEDGYIGSKVFISRFASDARASGDYPYAISLDLGEGEDLPTLLSGNEGDYNTIGAGDLDEVASLLDKTEFRYNSERRRMIIGDLYLDTDMSEANRAAYYTYAYYSAAQNGFDAFFSSSPLYSEGVVRSDFYYAVLMCGSNMTSQLSSYTDKLTNVSVPSFSEHKTLDLTYAQTPTLEVKESVVKNKKTFPATFEAFMLGGSAYNTQGISVTGKDGESLRAWLIESDGSSITGAVSATNISAKEIIKSRYVGITMSSDSSAKIALVISDENGVSGAFIGEAKIANAPTTYYFDISDFTKDVKASDTLTVSICLIPEGESVESVEISEIALYGSSAGGAGTVIIIVVVAIIIAALVALVILLAINRKKKSAMN